MLSLFSSSYDDNLPHMKPRLTSYHGGHSGQYCNHAQDRLEDIILQYIKLGFPTVGITEHIPPPAEQFLYPDEKELGLTVDALDKRFAEYIIEIRYLQKKYADQITIYAGMETETVTGYKSHIDALIKRFNPDYIVGSVHHIDDICFDYSQEEYDRLVDHLNGIETLYCRYFDLQFEMIRNLKPFVVGHFDLIRIYDEDYPSTLQYPEVEKRIDRNLELIRSYGLVMDFNLRPLVKGKHEPYISEPILQKVLSLGISVVPGDDSHSVAQAGLNVDKAVDILAEKGFNLNWPKPQLIK